MGGTAIGLLHPGEMGAAVVWCLTAGGHEVRWVSEGRGPATDARAAQAGLADAGTVTALAGETGIILSVCPPHAALPTARAVAAAGFPGVYVDANAISPGTACDVRTVIEAAGGRYVDGGIIGSPPGPAPGQTPASGAVTSPGGTRLYLAAGPGGSEAGGPAGQVAALFEGSALNPIILRNDNLTAASALKMAYAAWTKGSAALILSVCAGPGRGGGGQPAGRVGAVPAGARRPVAGRGPVRRGQRLALGRGDGGDRREHDRGRPARGVPPGRGGGVPPRCRTQQLRPAAHELCCLNQFMIREPAPSSSPVFVHAQSDLITVGFARSVDAASTPGTSVHAVRPIPLRAR
jgi:hypothetical protein